MHRLLILFSLASLVWLGTPVQSQAAAATAATDTTDVAPKGRKHDTFGWVALSMAVLGVALVALPYLSLPGLLLGLGGLVLGYVVRKKLRRPWVSRLTASLGGLVLAYFLIVVGLILFF